MNNSNFTANKAKQLDLVNFLASLGYQPEKIRNNDYWYLSPFRKENTASFKVNKKLNIWYDHGTGEGGNLIDFGIRYFKCSVADLLGRLSQLPTLQNLSFHPPAHSPNTRPAPNSFADEKKNPDAGKIVVLDTRPLVARGLLDYLEKRHIRVEVATRFCREVDFLLYGKKQTVIGFPNSSGGFELRSATFKGSSSPKDISFLDNNASSQAVFEGFFNFLSFQSIARTTDPLPNFLVLNSLAFLEKSQQVMRHHQEINLYLDRDNAGTKCTALLQEWNSKCVDRSEFYKEFKDLNEWIVHEENQQKQSLGITRRF